MKAFIDPSGKYWQTISNPDDDFISTYPPGTVEVPLRPSADHQWQGGAWVYIPPDPAMVLAAERAGMIAWKRAINEALRRLPANAAPNIPAGAAANLFAALEITQTALGPSHPLVQARTDIIQYIRLHPDVVAFRSFLDVSDAWIDGLFRLAMAIERGAAEGELTTLTAAVTA